VAVWVILNATGYIRSWGYHPFIFMNLVFSLQAAYTLSLIMMSQNRQDKLKAEEVDEVPKNEIAFRKPESNKRIDLDRFIDFFR
jgi:uncharacterized membrane protein